MRARVVILSVMLLYTNRMESIREDAFVAKNQNTVTSRCVRSDSNEVLKRLASLLRCVICQQRLDQPKILPCHHSCCLPCIEGQSSGGEIVCPECILGYRLPKGRAICFPDDVKTTALLYFEQELHETKLSNQTQSPNVQRRDVTNNVSELLSQLRQLKLRVKDFNACGDLWHNVIQKKDNVVLMVDKERPLKNITEVLRMRRQQLHDKLDAFLKEETQSIHERAEYEISRAAEYCRYVESILKKGLESKQDTAHMKSQCAVMTDAVDLLLSEMCDQIASIHLKIVKAVDDDSSHSKSTTLYGVDVGIQVSLAESTWLSSNNDRRLLERQRSIFSQSSIAKGRDNSVHHVPVAYNRGKKEPIVHKFQQQIPAMIPITTIMQPSNRIIQTDYCRNLHRVKAFGRNWFGGRGSRKGPSCLAVTSDSILAVTDGTNRCVRLCTMSGLSGDSYLGYNAVLQNFCDPQGVCEDAARRYLYVTDREKACVLKFDLDTGELLHTINSEGGPVGASCDQNGTFFVCDEVKRCVSVYHHNGTYMGNIGEKGALQRPHSVSIAPDNSIWVTDSNNHRLQVFTPTGKLIKSVGSRGSGLGQLKNPKGLAINHRGWVHVADYGNRRIQVFDSSGKPAVVFGKEETNLHWDGGPVGIAITRSKNKSNQDRIFVSYRGDHRIAVFMVQYEE